MDISNTQDVLRKPLTRPDALAEAANRRVMPAKEQAQRDRVEEVGKRQTRSSDSVSADRIESS